MSGAPAGPVAIQFATARAGRPAPATLRRWALAVLARTGREGAVTLRVVDAEEGAGQFRSWLEGDERAEAVARVIERPPVIAYRIDG